MRKLIYSAITTLDGFDGNEYFAPTDESHAYFNRLFEASDAVILDQENHELLVPYWDDVDLDDPELAPVEREFAELFRAKPRHVIDTRRDLEPVATAIEGDPVDAIAALREQPGIQLLLSTGPALLAACMAQGLVDEIEVIINPVLSGRGRPAFEGIGDTSALRLLETRSMEGGVVLARYAVD